jgi:hypothetical protein
MCKQVVVHDNCLPYLLTHLNVPPYSEMIVFENKGDAKYTAILFHLLAPIMKDLKTFK